MAAKLQIGKEPFCIWNRYQKLTQRELDCGGHALVLDATDRRLKAIISQVPTISGFEQLQRRILPDSVAKFEEALNEDELVHHQRFN